MKKNKNINILISILLFKEKLKDLIKKSKCSSGAYKGEIFYLDFFLVNEELFNGYLIQKGLKNIYDKIKDIDILKESYKCSNEEKEQILLNYIKNKGYKQEESSNNYTIIPDKKLPMDKIIVKNHKETISYHNNIYLLEEETIDLLNKKYRKLLSKNKCLIIDEYLIIFMKNKLENIFEIGKLNKEGIFNIDMIIKFTNNFEEEKKRLEKSGLNNYIKNSTVFHNDNNSPFYSISPFFNKDNKIIGNAYKINNSSKIKDFSDYTYNKIFIKMLYFIHYLKKHALRTNNKELILNNSNGSIIKDKYFLINEKFIHDFKKFYNYNKVLEDVENNCLTNSILNTMRIYEEEYLNNLTLKKFYIIIQNLPMTNKYFNDMKENKIYLSNEEPDLIPYSCFNIKFFIYDNFMLMNEDTYSKILDLNKELTLSMKYKNNFYECFFVDDLAFIILKKEFSHFNKMIIEVGTMKSDFIFELKYILIYNTEKDFYEHFKMINNQIGIKQFFKSLNFNSNSAISLENLSGQEIGYICLYKYNDNLQNNIDNSVNISIQQIKEYIPIMGKFNEPPRIGLQNVGATCYMNPTLQCLCQIEKFVDHFKSNERINTIINEYKLRGEDCLSTSFKNLIENLWPTDIIYIEKNKRYNLKNTNNKYFIPKEFKEKISKMNNLFEGEKASDSKDLINFIIMRLHEELNERKNNNNNFMAPPQEDQMSMYNYFKMNSDQENKSIISDFNAHFVKLQSIIFN